MSAFPTPHGNSPVLVDYMDLMSKIAESTRDERLLKQEMAKTNYTNIHKKRKKR